MENYTSYRYKALDEASYAALAEVAVKLSADVTLFPSLQTIVIAGDGANEAGAMIDQNGLSFHIDPMDTAGETVEEVLEEPVLDAATLRAIIQSLLREKKEMECDCKGTVATMRKRIETLEKSLGYHRKQTYAAAEHASRVRQQIEAIGTLIRNIYPERECPSDQTGR